MKNKSLFFLVIIITLISTISLDAQLFGKIVDRTKNKIENKVENAIADRIAEEISNRAVRKVDQVFDSMFQQSYEADSADWADLGKSYGDFLTEMNKAANLPASYQFDVELEIEVEDYNKEKTKMNMMLSNTKGIFGIRQLDDGAYQTIVVDTEQDIVALYNEQKKTVQALPNMMKFAGAMVKSQTIKNEFVALEKTSKTKKSLGYVCQEWKGENEKEKVKAYMAEDFPISWNESFGTMMKDFMPKDYQENMMKVKGFLLESENVLKEGNKKSKWKTKKVILDVAVIDNSTYKKTGIDK
jgi:hypothetical protein